MRRKFKDSPILEITLRKFEKPFSDSNEGLIRKLCMALGLLQPGDSRDVIVDILKLLLNAKNSRDLMDAKQVENLLKKDRDMGVAGSNIRRHLKRLKDLGIIERMGDGYRIREWLGLSEIFDEYVRRIIIEPTVERIKEYCDKIDDAPKNLLK